MHAIVARSTFRDPGRIDEVLQRAQAEFFPILHASPGLVDFYLIREQDGLTAALFFESPADADDFFGRAASWRQVLAVYSTSGGAGRGDVIEHVTRR